MRKSDSPLNLYIFYFRPRSSTENVSNKPSDHSYYFLFGKNVEPFPEGFRILAGNSDLRNFTAPDPTPDPSKWGPADKTQDALRAKSIGFNCLGQNEGSLQRHFLPDKSKIDTCTAGLRLEIRFPSCWDGKPVTSTDYKSHVAYREGVQDGPCPAGFDRELPTLFYETTWRTDLGGYKDQKGYYVLANGDRTGYGYHADFLEGWDRDTLTDAVKTCTNPSGMTSDCKPFLPLQEQTDMHNCKIKSLPSAIAKENTQNPQGKLPGGIVPDGESGGTGTDAGTFAEGPTGSAEMSTGSGSDASDVTPTADSSSSDPTEDSASSPTAASSDPTEDSASTPATASGDSIAQSTAGSCKA